MATPATSHLGLLIDEYQRRHSASIVGLADRIGISRQTLRQWRVGELRSLPTQANLAATAVEIGCPYAQVLDAALRDAGYLGPRETRTTDLTALLNAAAPFVEDALVSERYSGRADRRAQAAARPRQVRRGSWDQLSELLFQDHDVLTLYDLPPEATESLAGGVNLHPVRWFSEFTLPFPMPDRPS